MFETIQNQLQPITVSNFQELGDNHISFSYKYPDDDQAYSIVFQNTSEQDLSQIIQNILDKAYIC